jgi:hypothetical protein
MRSLVLAFALTTVLTAAADAQEQPEKHGASGTPSASVPDGPKYRLFVQDGQLASHGFDVFVTPDVPADVTPEIKFDRHHVVTKESLAEKECWECIVLAREQTRTVIDGGRSVSATGTLLVFGVPDAFFDLQFGDHVTSLGRGSVRGLPIVSWTEKSGARKVVASGDVYLTNIAWDWIWTLCVMAVLVGSVVWIACRATGSAVGFLLGSDGKMSLSHVQAALWTLAIGAVLLSYGLSRSEVPKIPSALVALMGLSFATNGFARVRSGVARALPTGAINTWRVSDILVAPHTDPGAGTVTLERAQMLFWTLALVGLFVAKSVLEGTMWDVPWELVALTGFSQAAYLSAKGKRGAADAGSGHNKGGSGNAVVATNEQAGGANPGGADPAPK